MTLVIKKQNTHCGQQWHQPLWPAWWRKSWLIQRLGNGWCSEESRVGWGTLSTTSQTHLEIQFMGGGDISSKEKTRKNSIKIKQQVATHQVPVSLTHSEIQRHFSFWPEELDLWFGLRNHSQPMIGESWRKSTTIDENYVSVNITEDHTYIYIYISIGNIYIYIYIYNYFVYQLLIQKACCTTLTCICPADGEAKMVVRSGLKTEVSWLKKFICTSLCRSSGFTALGNSFWSSTRE